MNHFTINGGEAQMTVTRRNGGIVTVLLDAADVEKVRLFNWCVTANDAQRGKPYAMTVAKGHPLAPKSGTLFMARLLLEAPRELHVDHISGDTLDNRRRNLRLATSSQNMTNWRRTNCNGYRGIAARPGGFIARINANGAQVYLGAFSDAATAARAYDAAARELHGEFAVLNFPTTDIAVGPRAATV